MPRDSVPPAKPTRRDNARRPVSRLRLRPVRGRQYTSGAGQTKELERDRKFTQFLGRAALVAACGNALLYSQAPGGAAKPQPDVLIFTDGEKLIGQLKSAKGDSVVFKSDMAGEVTVAWSKIQELHTSRPFAVIGKNAKLRRHMDVSQVPQGNVAMTDQKIAVQAAAGAPRTVPVADAGFVVGQPEFEKAMNREAGSHRGSQRGAGHPGGPHIHRGDCPGAERAYRELAESQQPHAVRFQRRLREGQSASLARH